MKIINKINQMNKGIDLGKKFPNYINKIIFRVGFSVVLILCLYLLLSFGFDRTWVNIKCVDRDNCNNPYVYCSNLDLTNIYLSYDTKKYCEFYNIDNCKGINCDTSIINKNEYIGEKPPRIVKDSGWFIMFIIALTFYFNHIYYILKKGDKNKDNNKSKK